MSYRDLRNFTEMMRGLGYTRLISMENFKKPNFPLVAEVLVWLVKRYDPNSDLTAEIDSVQNRIRFITSVAQFMVTKAHIKLNTKKLYQADGYAVKELLKVTDVLYSAIKANNSAYQVTDDGYSSVNFDISSKLQDLKSARYLASEITAKGASLYDLLNREVDLREIRSNVVGRQLELNDIEKKLALCIKEIEKSIKKTKSDIEKVAKDEVLLEEKLEKKRMDLERNQKYMEKMQAVRSPYMDEYEKLEEEMQKVYSDYMLKFRNMTYLEEILDEYEKAERERNEDFHSHLSEITKKTSDYNGLLDNGESEEEEEEENVNGRRPGQMQWSPQVMGRGIVVKGSMGMQGDIEDDEVSDDEEDEDEDDDDDDLSDASSDVAYDGVDMHALVRRDLYGQQRTSKWQQDDYDDEDGF